VCVCVCPPLVIQQTQRMHHIVMWPVRPYNIFLPLSNKWHDFIKMFLNTNCVFWLSLQVLFETFLILRRNERDMITVVYWS